MRGVIVVCLLQTDDRYAVLYSRGFSQAKPKPVSTLLSQFDLLVISSQQGPTSFICCSVDPPGQKELPVLNVGMGACTKKYNTNV